MTIVLVYEQGPHEGPEPRQLGSPFNTTVQPGHAFGVEDPEWAAALVKGVPQIRVVSGAPYPGWPGQSVTPAPIVQAEPPAAAVPVTATESVAEEPKKKSSKDKPKTTRTEGSASEH